MNEDYNYFQDAEFRQSLADYERMLETGEYIEFESETLTDIAEYYAMEQRMDEANRCIRYALSDIPFTTADVCRQREGSLATMSQDCRSG